MINKKTLKTQTVQSCSCISIKKKDKDLTEIKPEEEDNISLLLTIFDGLNNLYEVLNRLNYVIQRKKINLTLYPEIKGENK
jgi:hypothetical protein